MISGIAKNADGSSLFQRGNTQSLCSATVMLPPKYGTQLSSDKTPFSLNYEFPSFAVNEARNPFGRKSRREVGHGSLAKKALLPVLPSFSDFPFEIHVNSLITESDGSSSMATVCGGSLALANAGVPIKQLVAGIGIGLCPDCSKYPEVDYMCLTDILGFEDMQGLMDFKIAGTLTGITAMQLDIKLPEVSLNVLAEALEKAKVARASILKQMSTLIKSSSITPYLSRSSGFRKFTFLCLIGFRSC